MAVKRSSYRRAKERKPFWEGVMEWSLSLGKKLILPAMLIWLVGWLWLGGVFAKGMDLAWYGFVEWTAKQGLLVDDVVIEGRLRTNITNLQQAINIDKNSPVLLVDIDTIQNNVEKLPWVKSVVIGRHLNGIITVSLNERVPFVLWNRPGRGRVVVDTDGKVIDGANVEKYSSLLVVSGVDAPKYTVGLIQTLIAEPEVSKYVRGAEWVGDRRWDLLTSTGTIINLPDSDIGYALTRLAKLQKEKNILNRGLLSIDLRTADRIIIETERGEAHDAINLSSANDMNSI